MPSSTVALSVSLSQDLAETEPSSTTVCPHCLNNVNLPASVQNTVIPKSFISLDEFKNAANAALKERFKKESYQVAKALFLNWQANDLAPKIPEAGSYIFDETKSLMGIFRNSYHFDTEYFPIPSTNAKSKVQMLLAVNIADLSDQVALNKKVLLIIYYNGHANVKDGKLVWSA